MVEILNIRKSKGDGSVFCPRCGKHCFSDNKFCERCGYKVGVFSALINEIDELQADKQQESVVPPVVDEVEPVNGECVTPETDEANEAESKLVFEESNPEEETNVLPVAENVEAVKDMEEEKINNYFALSIWSAMLFSFVFGICALIFSAMTQTEQKIGNLDKAKIYSEKTKMFCRFAIAVGIAKLVVVVAAILAFGFEIDFLWFLP